MIKHRKPRGPMSPEQKEKIRQGHQKRREMMDTAKEASDQLRAGMIESVLKPEGQRPPHVTNGIGNFIETDFGTITIVPNPFLEQPPKPTGKVFEHHRCMNCGWIGRDLTFAEAIALHRTERHPCKPSLTQPSEKYLTAKMLEQANRNPHRVAQILARKNGTATL